MILAFRIIKSEDRGDTVKLTLAEDGIEDPKVNAVVLESDDLPGFKPGRYNYAFTEKDGPRPTVMVNGVEMWLQLLQTQSVFEIQQNVMQQAALMGMAWTSDIKSSKKSKIAKLSQFAVHKADADQILMVVAWK